MTFSIFLISREFRRKLSKIITKGQIFCCSSKQGVGFQLPKDKDFGLESLSRTFKSRPLVFSQSSGLVT